jgi:NAD(P)-dependent dehydrogenase (short-subunit alcohol dehydrogenase family)
VAVVTGSSSGIGHAIARKLAETGYARALGDIDPNPSGTYVA